MKKKHFIILGILGAGVAIGLLVSLITAEVVMKTSGQEFCGSCHSMQPMKESFAMDVHGGKNDLGFVADCATCHLPKSSVFTYLMAKAAHGVRDVFSETFTDTTAIDWEARKKEGQMVYDEGCLSCHSGTLAQNAERATLSAMHAMYKQSQETDKPFNCISCHTQVGHKRG